MLVPNMRDMAEVMAITGYSEETILDFGLTGGLVFLAVVPLVGACKVPPDALSHFMAGEEQYTAKEMPEHYTGSMSGEWVIKRDRLRILAESWDGLSSRLLDIAEGLDRASLPSLRTPEGYFTIEQVCQSLSAQRGLNDHSRGSIEKLFMQGARDDRLSVRDPQTQCVYQPSTIREDYDLVTVDDVNAFLETVKAPYRWEAQTVETHAPVVTEQAGDDGIDFAMLASPAQLIEAFGRFTGMDASWFDKWADYPVLKNAIRVKGTSGRGRTTEPLFCPFLVMQGLMKKPRKGSNRRAFQSIEKPWELLKRHFANVYATHQGLSPLDD